MLYKITKNNSFWIEFYIQENDGFILVVNSHLIKTFIEEKFPVQLHPFCFKGKAHFLLYEVFHYSKYIEILPSLSVILSNEPKLFNKSFANACFVPIKASHQIQPILKNLHETLWEKSPPSLMDEIASKQSSAYQNP